MQPVVRQQYSPVSVTAHKYCVACFFAATSLLQLIVVPSVLYYSILHACSRCHCLHVTLTRLIDRSNNALTDSYMGSLFHTLCYSLMQWKSICYLQSNLIKKGTFVCFSIGLPCVTTAQLHMLCCLPVHVAAQGICWGEE